MKYSELDLLICGATMAGLGAAAAATAANRRAVVVERTALAGHEFIETFNPGSGEEGGPRTPVGRKLQEEAVARNAKELCGPFHLPALHPILCKLVKEDGMRVAFLTETVEVLEQDGRYIVSVFDASGLHRIAVNEILDTSSQRLTEPGRLFVPAHRRLNAYLHHPAIHETAIPDPIDDSMSVVAGRYPSEVILRLSVPPKSDWLQARRGLYRYWESRPAEWMPWTIAAVAGAVESVVRRGPQRLADRWTWLPSEGFDHPIEAMDAGYEFVMAAEGIRHAGAL